MSTRSGKRIHSSIEEPVVENIFQLKSERNARSRQQKINIDLPVNEKKRKHYVRYPSEEEITSAETGNVDNMVKNTRKSRRHTLKEQNKLVDKSEPSIDFKTERSTRRSKKTGGKNDLANVELSLAQVVTEEKKKAKKQKVKSNGENIENVPDIETTVNVKKKSNKKKNKKKSNSLTITDVSETVNKKLNKSNASNDSFHSAAGSPVVHRLNSSNTNTGVHKKSSKTKNNNEDILEKELNMNSLTDKQNKKRKLSIEMACNQLNGLVRNSLREELPNEPEPDQLQCTFTTLTNDIETINNMTFEKNNSVTLNKSLGPDFKNTSSRKASCDNIHNINTTFEIDNANKGLNSSIHKLKLATKRSFNSISKGETMSTTSNISDNGISLNATFDMENRNQSDAIKPNRDGINDITYSGSKKRRKSSIKNTTYDKIDDSPVQQSNTMFENDFKKITPITDRDRESISTIDSFDQNKTESPNTTYTNTKTSTSCLNATFDKPLNLDSTFDKTLKKDSIDQLKMHPTAKSSLISSDTTDNSSLNITDDNSHVTINSDDSKLDNIVNTTPVLIESSMDESKTTTPVVDPGTIKNTLRREGTFSEETKTSAFIQEDMFAETNSKHTPSKNTEMLKENKITPQEPSLSEESDGTSLINTQITPKKKVDTTTETLLPITPLKREGTFTKDSADVMSPKLRIEITPRRKSLPSPGYTPYPVTKSSTKGKGVLNVTRSIEKSRRSSVADVAPRMTRVMFCSPENNPSVVTQMKGKVIKSNLKGSNKSFVFDESVSSLSRPARKRSYTQTEAEAEPSPGLPRQRTASAAGRLQDGPAPAKAEARRTKLPNFAALHQKQFQRMESLDDWQRRRSKRARLLSTPPALARPAPESQQKTQQSESSKKIETPQAKQQGAGPGFTKFGFKLNLDVNPFSFPQPQNTEVKPKEKKPVILKRQATLPSLAGATALRREIAKQTVMREKSYTEKKNVNRNETRTVIKGVRTNRRFELQMKMRNINN